MDKLLTRAARTIKRRALIREISVARKNEKKRMLCGLFVESGDHVTIQTSVKLWRLFFFSLQIGLSCC